MEADNADEKVWVPGFGRRRQPTWLTKGGNMGGRIRTKRREKLGFNF